jgi:hypothetical protein
MVRLDTAANARITQKKLNLKANLEGGSNQVISTLYGGSNCMLGSQVHVIHFTLQFTAAAMRKASCNVKSVQRLLQV